MTDRGSALMEVLIVGFITALLLSQMIVGFVRLQAAGDRATGIAQSAAIWAARSGGADDAAQFVLELDPNASVDSWRDGRAIHVVVRKSVSAIGPEGGPLRYVVVGRGSAEISPYRSDG